MGLLARTAPIATTALLLVPGVLGAEMLEYGVSTAASWNDDVFGQSDFSGRLTPYALLKDTDGELTWSLRYQPSYERYLDLSEVNGFDQDVLGTLSWRFAPTWSLSLRESYVTNQSALRFNEAALPGEEVVVSFEDQEVKANRASAVLWHALSPRDSLTLSVTHNMLGYEQGRRADPSSLSTAFSYQHVVSERTTAGLRFSWVQQSRDSGAAEDDSTFFYNLAGTLEHRFSPTLRLTAAAGPTLVDSSPPTELSVLQFAKSSLLLDLGEQGVHGPFVLNADDCEFEGVPGRASVNNFGGCSIPFAPIDPETEQTPTEITVDEFLALNQFFTGVSTVDEDGLTIQDVGGTDLTYFASLALVKDWEYWTGSLNYVRSNSESATFGSSSVADSLYARLTWQPDASWTLSLTAGVSFQEQVGDQAVPFAVNLVNVPAPDGVTSVDEVAQIDSIVASVRGNALEYRTESVSFSANRRLNRYASVFASVYWYSQEQDIDSPVLEATREGDNLRLSVGFRWNFDPVRF